MAGDLDPALIGRFDLVISRMVMEHVRDAKRAWTNISGLLAPGGVAFAFHPTLYAPPFLINWLAPEALTAPVFAFSSPIATTTITPSFRRATISARPNPRSRARAAPGRFPPRVKRAVLGRPLLPAFAGPQGGQRRFERGR